MEENLNVEQPEQSIGADAQIAEKDCEKKEDASTVEGSQLGKFKNAEELLKAYQNLEAEFTKKSQLLKTFEKTKEESADNTQDVPAFEKEDWIKTVQEFYENNPKAKGFEKEISSLILSDKQVATSTRPLEEAWKQLASKNFKTEDEFASDNEFLNKYVFSNPQIQETVLKNYLEKTEKAPALISSSKGKQINVAIRQIPKNLQEAKSAVEKLFS